MATPPDQIRVGAPVGQTPPVPAEPAPPPGGGPMLQLPAPQGGAISVMTEQMALRLASLMALAGTRELGRLGFQVEWNADRPDIVQRARAATDEMFGSIIQTAGQRVKDFFAQQLQSGQAPPQIAESLSGQFAGVPGRQARMVARTVTRQLYNEAALDAYEAAGVRHVTASDGHGGLTGKTDRGCVERNGKTYTIAEAREQEHSPTTHPNCTLSWSPVVPDTGLRSSESVSDATFEQNGHRHLLLAWEPDKHPRWPRGTPRVGGEFVDVGHLLDLLGTDDERDVTFLAHGAQRIARITAVGSHDFHGERMIQLHVHMTDGQEHTIGVPPRTPWPGVQLAIAAIDNAHTGERPYPTIQLDNQRGIATPIYVASCGMAKGKNADSAGQLYTGDLTRKQIDYITTRGAEGPGSTYMRPPTFILSAKYGLVPTTQRIEPYDQTLRGMTADEKAAWREKVRGQLDRLGAEHGLHVFVLAGAEYRKQLDMATADDPSTRVLPSSPSSGGIGQKKQALKRIADREAAARAANLRTPNSTDVVGGPVERVEEKDLRDIEAGERFRLVSDPTKLYDTYERVTKGPSQRTDRRITVRNTRTGKRVHMQPDRRIDHFTAEPEPQTVRIADLKPGDRFYVGEREYELLRQGGKARADGRITGREVATGKRVHFKPDREVQRRSTKPPDVKPPEPKPRRTRTDISKPPKGHVALNTLNVGDEFMTQPRPTSDGEDTIPGRRYRVVDVRGKTDRVFIAAPVNTGGDIPPDGHDRVDFGTGDQHVRRVAPIQVDDRTKPELPPEYERLPQKGESLDALRERIHWRDGRTRTAPDGYHYVPIPAAQWNDPKVKTIKSADNRYGPGRLYGSTTPLEAPPEGMVLAVVERQANRKVPWHPSHTHSFAGISRKNVVAVYDAAGEQVFYRAPAVPADKKPAKLIVGRRYPAAQIPEGSKVRYDGKQWQLRHVEHGVSLHRTTSDGSATNALLAPSDLVTYGVVEQSFPHDRIRATEKVEARRVDQGELVSLDGLVYQRTGITRKGDHVGVHLQLVGDRSAPIVRVPLDQELDAIQLSPPKGKMFAARNLAVGDTFRDSLGEWRVTERERGKAGAITIRAVTPEAPEGAPYDRQLGGRDSVLPGLTEPAANGRIFLWQIPDGAHFTIHEGRGEARGYRMLREAGRRAGQYEVEDLQTGRDHMLYDRGVPSATLGLPEGVEPLPPRVEVPGTRLRDFSGDKFSVGGVRYQRTGSASGPRGTISAYNLVGSDDEADQLHHLPASTLVVPDGERDPYGSGAQRQQNLIDKAAEVYESRRVPVTLQEFQDAGAIVHAAILAPFDAGSPGTPDAFRRELRDVLGQIRGYGRQRFRVAGVEGADTDANGRGVALHPPNLQDEAKIEEASRWLPDSWVEHVNENHGTNVGIGPQLGRAFYRHYGLIGKGRMVAVSANERQNVVLHEFVHRVEHELPELMRLASEFWDRRTAGEPDVPIYGGRDEITKEDHFHQRYAGKRYGYRGGGEILSMGIEDLVHPMNRGPDNRVYRLPTARPGMFNILRDDPDYAHFLLGLLAAYKTEREAEQRLNG